MKTKTYKTPYAFFFARAGYSYNASKGETRKQGRIRCAQALAKAEDWAKLHLSFSWSIDRDADSSDFSDEKPSWSLWVCTVHDSKGQSCASLCGIDFGRNGEPWGHPYKRVVEAEMALEQMT